MTNQQVQYIVELRLYELAMGKGGRKSVTKKFWARLLDKTWQTSNTRQITDLVKRGFLTKIIGAKNTAIYSLTDIAVKTADRCIAAAEKYQSDFSQPELFEVGENVENAS